MIKLREFLHFTKNIRINGFKLFSWLLSLSYTKTRNLLTGFYLGLVVVSEMFHMMVQISIKFVKCEFEFTLKCVKKLKITKNIAIKM